MKVRLRTKFIKHKMLRKHLSQNCIAQMAGVSSGYMSQLMKGSRHPSPDVTRRLETVFPECKFEELFLIK